MPFSEGLAAACQKPEEAATGTDLWGYIDKTGAWILPPRYKNVSPFHDGLAAVQQEGESLSKYIDHSGKTVAGPFNAAWSFSEGLARVRLKDGSEAFIDRKG